MDPLEKRLRVVRMKQDDRELQAQMVTALNRIQRCNERMRAALLTDDRELIVILANVTAEQSVTLISLATL
jgi:hypothetical protein